jgi:GTPase SAR1 family protein
MREESSVIEKLQKQGLKPVSKEDGESTKKTIKAVAYVECSAKTQQGVKEVFDKAIRTVLISKNTQPSKKCEVL